MSSPVIDNASTQITDKALIELVRRLDPFFKSRSSRGGSAAAAAVLMRLSTHFGNQFSTDSDVAPLALDWEFGGFTFTPASNPTPASWSVPVSGYYQLTVTCDALLNVDAVDELVMELIGMPSGDSANPWDSYLQFDGSLPFGTQFRAPMGFSGQLHLETTDTLSLSFSSSDEWLVSHILVSMQLLKGGVSGSLSGIDGGSP